MANKDGNIKTAPNNPPAPASPTEEVASPAHWAAVKIALINSMRKGVFFDRMYWARNAKAGDVLKPIYLSSIVMDDKAQQLKKLVKYLKARDTFIKDREGGVNVESDYEVDLSLTIGPAGISRVEKEEYRATLTTGSFSAWRSLFFYRCTDKISFAPLKSQGADPRSGPGRRKISSTAAQPCSPKSIYVLASLLGIEPLADSALADIKSKINLKNVVEEVFSWVAASQEKVMEMQCDLLISNFKNPKTIALVKEKIEHISDGSSPHCATALKLGFKKAFELKWGVGLRCTYGSCQWYNNHLSYSSVGSNTYCQNCNRRGWGNRYLRCAGCGYNRTSNYQSCQSCRKRFI